MASVGPAAGRGASTATAPPSSGWKSGVPAVASIGLGGFDGRVVHRTRRNRLVERLLALAAYSRTAALHGQH